MKIIQTEYGPMLLNDWREIKLRYAHKYARLSSGFKIASVVSMWLFAAMTISLMAYIWIGIYRDETWIVIGSSALGIVTALIGKLVICSFLDLSNAFLVIRQELVDEVAATMRANR